MISGSFSELDDSRTAQTSVPSGRISLASYLIPGVAALLAEQVGDRLDGRIGDVVLAALLAVEYRDGHAPDALAARCTSHCGREPCRSCGHCPRPGMPVHAVDGLVAVLFEGVNGAEPLLGGAEDDGIVAAPAVRVLVGDVLHSPSGGRVSLHMLKDNLVGIPDRSDRQTARQPLRSGGRHRPRGQRRAPAGNG